MKTNRFLFNFLNLFALTLMLTTKGYALQLSEHTTKVIGDKIWKNECSGKIEGLTHWNEGENFGSFGIGHFIWYPRKNQERFHDTFPELIVFLKNCNVEVPKWIQEANGCPWSTKQEFYANIDTEKMVELRNFLLNTKEGQAAFMVYRLENALPDILSSLCEIEKTRAKSAFLKLSETPQGLYALIDYANCKGLGTVPSESYKGQGWGLKQVLIRIPIDSKNPLEDFVKEAKSLLTERVENSPQERNEKRWLKGWFNRLDTYLSTSLHK